MTSTDSYDLIVIGAGPGGYVAAIRAAQLGMNVACIEKEPELGGTCLRVGCIPSKALLDSSELYWQAKGKFGEHGVVTGDVYLDLEAMMLRKSKVVKNLTRGVASLFKKNKIERITGTARFVARDTVEVEGKNPRRLQAKHILVATGSTPATLPGLEFDGKHVVHSDHAVAFEAVPKRMLVIGSGAVGLELGSVWARLGAEVQVVEILDRIVPGFDRQMSTTLQKSLKKQGLSFQLGTGAKTAEVDGGQVHVTLEGEGSSSNETADVVLVSIGRRPYTDGLGLDDVGVEIDDRGRIDVDEHFRTSAESIYAIGDVIRGPMLAHKAEDEGMACVERIAGVAGHVNYDAIPNVVYTSPELASVGKTEQACEEASLEIRTGTFPFAANGRARALGEVEGLVKVIADARTDRILGLHILGPRASDLIAEAALAIEFGASAEDLARTSHAHPTLPEAVREAALAVASRTIHI